MLQPTLLTLLALLAAGLTGEFPTTSPQDVEGEPEHAPEGEAEHVPESESELVGYDDGFFLRNADGSAELVIEGLFQVIGRVNEPRRQPATEFELKRMRPEFSGRFDEVYRFRLEPNFSEDDVELEEAWAGFDVNDGDGLWMLGRMKAPFGLEEVRSRRHIAFPEFSILNQFTPAEQHGIFFNGRQGPIESGFGLYNGGGGDEGDDGKEIAMRVMLHPFHNQSGHLQNLQVGMAATYGREDRSAAGEFIKNAAGKSLMIYDPAARFDGDQLRVGLEAAWFDGPRMTQAEWIWTRADMDGATGTANIDTFGAYVTFQNVLTGEDISFDGVQPQTNFRPGERTPGGASVAAMRFSYLTGDPSLAEDGVVLPETFTSDVFSVWVGLNWYLNEHVILRNSYVHSFYAGEVFVDGHTLSTEGALIFELQMHF